MAAILPTVPIEMPDLAGQAFKLQEYRTAQKKEEQDRKEKERSSRASQSGLNKLYEQTAELGQVLNRFKPEVQKAFDDAIKLVNQGIYGGAYGPEKQFLAKFTGIGSPQKVENTEVFMANIGEIVIPRLQQFGGNDSNEELKYLQKVVAGELRMEPKAMLRVLESAERKTRNNIERLQKQTSGKPGEALPTTPMNAPLGSPQNPIKLKDK